MESARLSNYLEAAYIPPQKPTIKQEVPSYHPCLIVQDKQTDVTKLKPCGCADSYCVKMHQNGFLELNRVHLYIHFSIYICCRSFGFGFGFGFVLTYIDRYNYTVFLGYLILVI